MSTDADYYTRRIAEERAAATSAANEAIGKRHSELAGLYDEKLKAILTDDEPSPRPMLRMAFDNSKLAATG